MLYYPGILHVCRHVGEVTGARRNDADGSIQSFLGFILLCRQSFASISPRALGNISPAHECTSHGICLPSTLEPAHDSPNPALPLHFCPPSVECLLDAHIEGTMCWGRALSRASSWWRNGLEGRVECGISSSLKTNWPLFPSQTITLLLWCPPLGQAILKQRIEPPHVPHQAALAA